MGSIPSGRNLRAPEALAAVIRTRLVGLGAPVQLEGDTGGLANRAAWSGHGGLTPFAEDLKKKKKNLVGFQNIHHWTYSFLGP